ncbi:11665_t:CDS:2, partial [Funneliformis mosseae]
LRDSITWKRMPLCVTCEQKQTGGNDIIAYESSRPFVQACEAQHEQIYSLYSKVCKPALSHVNIKNIEITNDDDLVLACKPTVNTNVPGRTTSTIRIDGRNGCPFFRKAELAEQHSDNGRSVTIQMQAIIFRIQSSFAIYAA